MESEAAGTKRQLNSPQADEYFVILVTDKPEQVSYYFFREYRRSDMYSCYHFFILPGTKVWCYRSGVVIKMS